MSQALKIFQIVSANEVDAFAKSAKAGERLEYYRGSMAADLGPMHTSPLDKDERERLKGTAAAAAHHVRTERLILSQQRHGIDDYSYFATRTHFRAEEAA